MFLYDSQSENSLVNVQILGLTPGVTYRFGVVKSPTSDFPEYVGEQIQTTSEFASFVLSSFGTVFVSNSRNIICPLPLVWSSNWIRQQLKLCEV